MTHGIGTVSVRRLRDGIIVQGFGKTPRGQNFIGATEKLKAKKFSDKGFKDELEIAIEKILNENEPSP